MISTRDRDRIQKWAGKNRALPAHVASKVDGKLPILTFAFADPDFIKPELSLISWEMFFAQLDLLGLSLVFHGTRRFSIVIVERRPTSISSEA